MQLIFKTDMLICQSKAMLDAELLFREIANHLDLRTRKILVWVFMGRRTACSMLVNGLLATEIYIQYNFQFQKYNFTFNGK